MKRRGTSWTWLSGNRLGAIWVFTFLVTHCASENIGGSTMPVGASASIAPATELSLRETADATSAAKTVLLAVQWDGRSIESVSEPIELRFFRENDGEPFFETTWHDLVRSSQGMGCSVPDDGGESSMIALCDGRLGNLGKISRVEGLVRGTDLRKKAIKPDPIYIGPDTAKLFVLLY